MFSWCAAAQINRSLFDVFNTFLKSNQAQLVSFVVALLYFASLAWYFSLFLPVWQQSWNTRCVGLIYLSVIGFQRDYPPVLFPKALNVEQHVLLEWFCDTVLETVELALHRVFAGIRLRHLCCRDLLPNTSDIMTRQDWILAKWFHLEPMKSQIRWISVGPQHWWRLRGKLLSKSSILRLLKVLSHVCSPKLTLNRICKPQCRESLQSLAFFCTGMLSLMWLVQYRKSSPSITHCVFILCQRNLKILGLIHS